MVRGIIYMYTSPCGKSYIGQTTNEAQRRKLWNSVKYHYAGQKIDRARAKYGKENFIYSVLFDKEFASKSVAVMWLNVAEQYYIQQYNTLKGGYNCEVGGGSNYGNKAPKTHPKGYKLSDEAKKHIGEGAKRWQNTPEGRAKMAAARKGIKRKKGYRAKAKYKAVIQLSLDGEFIQEFPSIKDASTALFTENRAITANISNVCRGLRDSAGGYKWMFKEDYFNYFLHPQENVPERVRRVINFISRRNALEEKRKQSLENKIKRPRINRFVPKVGQYGPDYNLVKIWRCASEAAHELKINAPNISRAIKTLGMYMGSYWRKYDGQQICIPKPKKKIEHPAQRKKVVQKDLNGNIIKVHESVTAAYKCVGANNNVLISRALNGKVHTAYGYIWENFNCA